MDWKFNEPLTVCHMEEKHQTLLWTLGASWGLINLLLEITYETKERPIDNVKDKLKYLNLVN
jgi:hypothetical protein